MPRHRSRQRGGWFESLFGNSNTSQKQQPQYGQSQPQYGQSQPQYGESQPQYGQSQPQYGQSQPQYGQPPYGGRIRRTRRYKGGNVANYRQSNLASNAASFSGGRRRCRKSKSRKRH